MKNLSKMMKDFQKIQADMARMQEEVQKRTVEATSGGGVVKVVVNGAQEIVEISIDKSVVDPEDVEMLQDLIISAVNEGLKKSREMIAEELGKITGGLNLDSLKGLF